MDTDITLFLLCISYSYSLTSSADCSSGYQTDSMYANDILQGGQAIVSTNGKNQLLMGTDGSLQLIDPQGTYWSQFPANPNKRYLIMQSDGNLVLYDICATGSCPVWATGTQLGGSLNPSGSGPFHLFLQNDMNLVLIDGAGAVLWSTGTYSTLIANDDFVCQPCSAGTYSSALFNLCANCASGMFSGVLPFSFSLNGVAVRISTKLISRWFENHKPIRNSDCNTRSALLFSSIPPPGSAASSCALCSAGSYSPASGNARTHWVIPSLPRSCSFGQLVWTASILPWLWA